MREVYLNGGPLAWTKRDHLNLRNPFRCEVACEARTTLRGGKRFLHAEPRE